ncbi:lysophospholipid acyltransferase family protein [Ovoidimarina sediminis]|uniref:lysophospholipid acyltransferase family protein n=1 Tax=Ovoidimarina sediminis TaxID=3079856 RepID=UPI00290BCECC|nr:lysophospholipid acyltransferase family protein [Rhodophyticola sp. MJ-SS7]MDU8944034.1 lysophospholipid acyltransferase family protein [Rhodophyticola sp. MJ-SS7]
MQWLRSLLFNAQIYIMMLIMALVFFPFAVFSRDWALRACHTWCRWVICSARWMVGLRVEIRGTPPTIPCIVAAKHQSFFDIIVIFGAVPLGRFIMKRELMFAPILGQYALRIGCVPVNRGKRGQAIAKMVADVNKGLRRPGQLIIYPQGTRVAPGDVKPYKIGTGILYEQLGQPCVPVATNIGLFWPKRGVLRKQGTAVVDFLETIPPGLSKEAFIDRLGTEVETRSNALMAEAGFIVPKEVP